MRIYIDRKPPLRVAVVQFCSGEGEDLQRVTAGHWKLEIGLGDKKALNRREFILLVRRIIMAAKEKKLTAIAIDLSLLQPLTVKMIETELVELMSTNICLADYAFEEYKTKPKEGFLHMKEVYLLSANRAHIAKAVQRGLIIGEETNRARHVSTMPASELTPQRLAQHARQAVKGQAVRVTVWNERQIEQAGMAGIIAVGRGSTMKPRFIILDYRGGKKGESPTVLIGKGVTFDAGGINLKPSTAILGMNMDMSGGACVIHTLVACARLKVKQNLIVLVPAVENMLSGSSYRPGDIIRTLSGKTIEVQDTDAEGRIILAEALTYAKRYTPKLVIDVATLTGSAMVALGERSSALFTVDESLETKLRHIGSLVGDPVWPLPLWDEYLDDIKGTYGDIGNVGNTKWGGAITAAIFLKQFVDYPWVHIDIAPRMTAISGERLAKGSIGAGVQLLVRFLKG